MSAHYFDASVMVKYYLDEPGSMWVRALIDARDGEGYPLHDFLTTSLSWVEVPSAIAAIQRAGRMGKTLRDRTFDRFMNTVAHRYQILPAHESILMRAAHLTQKHALKAYDAVHLATALEFNSRLRLLDKSIIFISGDSQLLRAASAEGLPTDNPFTHAEE